MKIEVHIFSVPPMKYNQVQTLLRNQGRGRLKPSKPTRELQKCHAISD